MVIFKALQMKIIEEMEVLCLPDSSLEIWLKLMLAENATCSLDISFSLRSCLILKPICFRPSLSIALIIKNNIPSYFLKM